MIAYQPEAEIVLFGGLTVSRSTYDRHAGCNRCQFGLLNPEAVTEMRLPLHRALVVAYRAGDLHFCDCESGDRMKAGILADIERQGEHAAALRREVQAAKAAKAERIFANAQVPARFADLTAAGYIEIAGKDRGKAEGIRLVREYYARGCVDVGGETRFGLYLWGRTDQGKTGLLCPLFLHYIRQGESGLWLQYNDLQASLRDFESGKVEERIQEIQRVAFLFVDDWGDPASDKVATDYSRDTMFRIIDYRNGYKKPTFITSNLSPMKLAGQFHERMGKRLAELCAIVEVTGEPMRDLIRYKRQADERKAEYA